MAIYGSSSASMRIVAVLSTDTVYWQDSGSSSCIIHGSSSALMRIVAALSTDTVFWQGSGSSSTVSLYDGSSSTSMRIVAVLSGPQQHLLSAVAVRVNGSSKRIRQQHACMAAASVYGISSTSMRSVAVLSGLQQHLMQRL